MRRSLIIASLTGSLIIFAMSIDLLDAVFMFVFFGVTPFRAEPIPALEMLIIYSAAGLVVVAYALRSHIKSIFHSLHRKATQPHVS